MDYLKEFGTGFAVGLTFEFVIVPGLSVAGRGVIRALSRSRMGPQEVAELLAKEMRAGDIEEAAAQGMKNLEEALTNTVKPEKLGLMQEFMQALRQQWKEVVEHARAVQEPKGIVAKLRSEWTSRAVKDLFEAAKVELKPDVQRSLEILIRTTSRDEMNKVVERVLRSDRLRLFLETKPRLGTELLTRAFRGTPDELESFLLKLEKMPSAEANKVLEALVRIGIDDAGQVVLNSGKTVEQLLELIGKDSAAAKPLGAYSKQVIGKRFQDLTRRDFANSATWQDKLFNEAKGLRDRQELLKDQILSEVNRGGKGGSILKRDTLKEFVPGVLDKMERNKYARVSEMDDIVRGRFNMPDREGVEKVAQALRKQEAFKVKEVTAPRLVKGTSVVRYPRYHVILEDAETGIAHEWQVGTQATTDLYEEVGIVIPKEMDAAAKRLGKKFHNDLHDIEYDVFQQLVKQKENAALATKLRIPEFIADVAKASNRSFEGEAFTELNETIKVLHERASEILEGLVSEKGGEWVAKFFH
jgi:hypothetical protein